MAGEQFPEVFSAAGQKALLAQPTQSLQWQLHRFLPQQSENFAKAQFIDLTVNKLQLSLQKKQKYSQNKQQQGTALVNA